MTVNASASACATACHIKCVSGNPCSNRTGGPLPLRRMKMLVSPTSTVDAANPSNMQVNNQFDPAVPNCTTRRGHVVPDGNASQAAWLRLQAGAGRPVCACPSGGGGPVLRSPAHGARQELRCHES